jgi:signal peptidase II
MLKKYSLYFSFLLLFIGIFSLDQSSKLHVQKRHMSFSHPQNTTDYAASSDLIFTWGHSPLSISQAKLADPKVEQEVTKNWLNFEITYLRNHGAIWGIMSDNPTKGKLVAFYCMTGIAILGVFFLFKKSRPNQHLYRCALIFVMGGALGNFFDRIMLQYVIDWLHFSWRIFGWEYSFPVFNIADVSIDVGIGLMILDSILNPEPATAPKPKETSSADSGNLAKA